MAKREPPGGDAASPQISLRQAVRPVIVAHGILADQRLAASALAEEAETLLDLTENLLRKLGLVHMLTAGSVRPAGAPAQADQADRLVEAYAQVGISWSLVVSSVTKLAERLMADSDWPTVRLITNLLAESGESAVSKHIETLADSTREARVKAQLAQVRPHAAMSPAEVRDAVHTLIELEAGSQKNGAIKTWRTFLVASTLAIAQQRRNQSAVQVAGELYSRCDTLNKYPSLEGDSKYAVSEESLFTGLISVLDMCEGR